MLNFIKPNRMIKEYEKYHGIALSRFINIHRDLRIRCNINNDNSSYIFGDEVGIYIKYSKKRLSPWQFNFDYSHFNSIENLKKRFKNGYVVFVCKDDGICCVPFDDFSCLINSIDEKNNKTIQISRMKREKYKVTGTDGEIKHKFADSYIDIVHI